MQISSIVEKKISIKEEEHIRKEWVDGFGKVRKKIEQGEEWIKDS